MRLATLVPLLAILLASCGGTRIVSRTPPEAATSDRTLKVGGLDAAFRGELALRDTANPIEVADNYFEPNVLVGAPNQVVTLDFTNGGAALHNFTVTELGLSQDFKPGLGASVRLTLPPRGQVEFFCKYHREESRMVGVLRATS